MKLNRTDNLLSREARIAENQNWQTIEDNFNNVVQTVSDKAYGEVVDAAKLNWKEPVSSFSNLPTTANTGDTVMVRDTGKVYRYNGTEFKEIQEIDAGPVNEVDSRLTSQLAEKAQEIESVRYESSNIQHSKRKALVSFVTDDGSEQDYIKLKPLSETYGIPFTAAIISDMSTITTAQALELQNSLGWEIASHSEGAEVLSELTDENEIDRKLRQSKQDLTARGFNVKNVVYPGGGNDERVRRIAKRYYRCGVGISNPIAVDQINTNIGTNKGIFPSFNITRVGLGSYFDPETRPEFSPTNTLDYYKERVDQAVSEGSWLVFMLHPGDPDHDTTQQSYLEQTIQYIQSLNVDIINVDEGFDMFGNALEIGDYKGSIFSTGKAIDKDGNLANFPMLIQKTGMVNNDTPIDDFQKFTLSSCSIFTTHNANFPTSAGTILTYNMTADPTLAFQEWHDYFSEAVYKRRWKSAGWTTWDEYVVKSTAETADYIVETPNTTYNSLSVPTTFPQNKIVSVLLSGAGNVDGLPDNSPGILTTYRLGGNGGFDKQEFRKYNSNELWSRYSTADNSAWTTWVKISVV